MHEGILALAEFAEGREFVLDFLQEVSVMEEEYVDCSAFLGEEQGEVDVLLVEESVEGKERG